MNCDAIVCKGSVPWQPKADARNFDAWHFYDVPLLGTFELHDTTVLFACLTGAMDRISVWGYTEMTASDLDRVAGFDCDTTEQLTDFAYSFFVGRRAAFAVSDHDVIDEWSSEYVDAEGPLPAATRFMDLLIARTGNLETARAHKREAEQARADATRQVLEPA